MSCQFDFYALFDGVVCTRTNKFFTYDEHKVDVSKWTYDTAFRDIRFTETGPIDVLKISAYWTSVDLAPCFKNNCFGKRK